MILVDVPKSKGQAQAMEAYTEKKMTDMTKNPRPGAVAQW